MGCQQKHMKLCIRRALKLRMVPQLIYQICNIADFGVELRLVNRNSAIHLIGFGSLPNRFNKKNVYATFFLINLTKKRCETFFQSILIKKNVSQRFFN